MAQEPDLSDLLLRTFLFRHARLTQLGAGLTLVGSRFDINTRRLLEVLARNRLSFRWLELESSPEAESMLRQLEVPPSELPLVVVPGGSLLRNPDGHEVLGALGLIAAAEHDGSEVCDLLVVGAGPAGLSAAVYGASEGMTTTPRRGHSLGRPSGHLVAYRELPRLSRRALRRRVDDAWRPAGPEVRGADPARG